MRSVTKSLVVFAILLSALPICGGEWNRFRGPNATGVSSGRQLPVEFERADALWTAKLAGHGNSSPILHEQLIYITSAELEPESMTGKRSLVALDLESGEIKWQRDWSFDHYKTNRRNGYASSSVCTDADGVYVFWQSEVTSTLYGMNHQGDPLWEYEVGKFSAGTGAATSPIVHDGVVLLSHDNEKFESFLLAIATADGNPVWKTMRKTQRTGYSTPVIYPSKAGRTQVVFSHSYEGMVGVDFTTGEVQWQNVVFGEHTQRAVGSPIVVDDQVIAASGFTNGVRTLVSLKPDQLNDRREAQEHFRTTRNVPHCPTPLALGGNLYCWTDRGVLACLNLSDGRQRWLARVGGEYFASPIALGNRILCIDRSGEIVVIAAGDTYRELGRSQLDAGVMATPALSQNALIIRTANEILRFDLADQ